MAENDPLVLYQSVQNDFGLLDSSGEHEEGAAATWTTTIHNDDHEDDGQLGVSWMDASICQTLSASPAEPGELPFH